MIKKQYNFYLLNRKIWTHKLPGGAGGEYEFIKQKKVALFAENNLYIDKES